MSAQISLNPFARSKIFRESRLHLGIGGSVACYKAADLLRAWLGLGIRVSATLTDGAREFIKPLLIRSLGADPVYGEMFGDANVFAHLEPGQNAQAMAIAPASANLLSRLACGAASDMLSAQVLAFSGPVVLAPAMNPRMWANAATQANVETLTRRGYILVPPGIGETACGDRGQGRLACLADIFLAALKALSPQDMAGQKVMVTLGPTREYWDGARFWSNPSTGRMGAALATSAWLRGAEVTAVCGPGISICLPGEIRRIDVLTASEMLMRAAEIWPEMNMGLFSAAVADFAPIRPDNADNIKIKKTGMETELRIGFSKNPDILATLAANRSNGQKALGFAAEITSSLEALLPLAEAKITAKNADLLAANRVNAKGGAFGADDDSVLVIDKNGHNEVWDTQSKADIAWELCSWLLRI